MIPILDLTAQYHTLKPEIDAAIEGVLSSGTFIMGPNVEAFEHEIAEYLGSPHAIALNSGTDALHLAFRALGIGPGDEVITSPFSFVASTEAIGLVGATPVFVDIDEATFNIDPQLIESAITSRTRAILPVHLYGLPADMNAVQKIALRHGLAVVEDCAQAIGAHVDGRKVGTVGDIGCFSFFPTKNLGAYGDGGLVTTNDRSLADRLKSLRVHGGKKKYYHEELGLNSRLDELQAAVLRVKLPRLDSWIQSRRRIAARYKQVLQGSAEIVLPEEPLNCFHVYHQFTVRLKDRDTVQRQLKNDGIQSMVYYPLPLHLQEVNRGMSAIERLERSERAAAEVLSLPIYPELTPEAQDQVLQAVARAIDVRTAV